MQNRILLTALPFLLLVLVAGVARADEVTLKNGKKVTGFLISNTDKWVKIITANGRTATYKQADVLEIIEGPEIGVPKIDAKLAEIDLSNPNALGAIAAWAKEQGLDGYKCVAEKALSLDENHEVANKVLGNVFAIDKWFSNEKLAENYAKKKHEEDYKAKGYKKHRGGWVKEDQLAQLRKDEDAFLLDPKTGEWLSKSELGMVKRGNAWLRLTQEDSDDAAKFKELFGVDILPLTTEHFRLFVMQYPPEEVAKFGELAEQTYAWFLTTMGKSKDFPLFQGNKSHIWIFKDKQSQREWLPHYRNRYSLGDGFAKIIERDAGNVHAGRALIAHIVPQQGQDIRNNLVHMVGHALIDWFSPGLDGTPPWLSEAMAHTCEHAMLGNGQVNCSTLSKYAKDGGVAEKSFTTQDAKDRAKGLIRRKEAKDFISLNRTDLNSLTGNDLTKGWTLITWLLEEHKDKLIAWLEKANTADRIEALKSAFSWEAPALDKNWEDRWDR